MHKTCDFEIPEIILERLPSQVHFHCWFLPYVLAVGAALGANFNVHVAVDLRERFLGQSGTQMESVAILREHMRDESALVELSQRQVAAGRPRTHRVAAAEMGAVAS